MIMTSQVLDAHLLEIRLPPPEGPELGAIVVDLWVEHPRVRDTTFIDISAVFTSRRRHTSYMLGLLTLPWVSMCTCNVSLQAPPTRARLII
jgi:hypothetical protein